MRDITRPQEFIVNKAIKISSLLAMLDIFDSNMYINAAALRLVAALAVYRHEKGEKVEGVIDPETRAFINKELEFIMHEYEGKI